MRVLTVLFAFAGAIGCSKSTDSGNVPALHPVRGVVQMGGLPVNGGELFIRPDQSHPNLVVSATVGNDGKFEVFSMDAQDRQGKRHSGAPEGTYQLTYSVPSQDQTVAPTELARQFTVEAKSNEWIVELREKK